MMRMSTLAAFGLFSLGLIHAQAAVWINEIHYDNASDDIGEFVELAGTAGTVLTGWSIILYNGSNGLEYDTIDLSGSTIDDEGNGFGALAFFRAGIQNGAPDGLALVDDTSTVLQFLSYEGTFTAVDDLAIGLLSTDIGVSETGSTPIGFSLQLTGSGFDYSDFTWQAPAAESPGSINFGQSITAVPEPSSLVLMGICLLGLTRVRRRR